MKVHIPTPLRSYTGQRETVDVAGSTLEELLTELDRCYPGFRFRIINEQDKIREHIKIFIDQNQAENLAAPLRSGDEVQIICALSGGSGYGIPSPGSPYERISNHTLNSHAGMRK